MTYTPEQLALISQGSPLATAVAMGGWSGHLGNSTFDHHSDLY